MYVELHARSAFSFLEGASTPEELIENAARLGFPALALLDRDGVYGAPRFHMAAQRAGVRAHIGAEVSCEVFAKQGRGIAISDLRFQIDDLNAQQPASIHSSQSEIFNLPLLVSSRAGYQNLCQLITKMKLRAKKGEGAVRKEELREHAGGLICLTGGDAGPLAKALTQGSMEEARRTLIRLIEIFGPENIYVELQRHFHREQEARNQAAIALAREFCLPLLATNSVSYAQPQQRRLLDVLTAIRHHHTVDTAGRLLARNSERYLKSAAEMARIFADLPEAIANACELSARLDFTLDKLGYAFPKYPVPEGETMMSLLRERALQGFRERYGRAATELRQRARRQVERELALIEKLELPGYFLIVWDLVRFCREQKILVQGRGSAANSAVCYSLGITAVDPVGMDLLFERFLSEERGEWPDIDLDLPSGDQRERVIQYLYRRYGERGAAMTANVITYRSRMAAREVGKALGFDPETLNRLAAVVGGWEYRDANDTLERRFRDAGLDLRHPRLRQYFEMCEAIRDLPRHLGQHSGGMVICQGQLDSVVPLEPASMPGRVVVQWDKEDCADLGIVKVDLLGLGMMAALEDSVELIRRHYKEEVDLAHLPPDDPAVYDALQKADTIGMFQVESRAQMSSLPRLRPERFYDIVVQVAIIRPGPIVGQMVNPYLKRRQGREVVTYPHPSLEPVLARTLGVPLFQEQILRMAMITAGFTGGEGEELRRAMGFKRSQARMQEIETRLRAGMQHNGIGKEAQEQIIQFITSFALYGFPESHAASFALIAYASAYLKCHYMAAFVAALLNNQPMGFYHPATLVKDAQRHGLKILPIDVTHSEWNCTLEAGSGLQASGSGSQEFTVRLGLRYVRGLREETAQSLVRERYLEGFASIHDLARRVPELQKDELVTLADIGALNSVSSRSRIRAFSQNSKPEARNLKFHRRDALWQVERAVRRSGELLEQQAESDEFSPLAPMNAEERIVADFHGTGLTVDPHPMAYHRSRMKELGVHPASELAGLPQGKNVRVAGCVIARQRPGTARGFLFLSLEDETGIANAIVTPDVFNQNRFLLASEHFILVEGVLQNQDNVISVKAAGVYPLHVTHAEMRSHDFH
jgi:error-prone DNA polymerase